MEPSKDNGSTQLQEHYDRGLISLAKLYIQQETVAKQLETLKTQLAQIEVVMQYAKDNESKNAELVE
jgi:hypothetical protein